MSYCDYLDRNRDMSHDFCGNFWRIWFVGRGISVTPQCLISNGMLWHILPVSKNCRWYCTWLYCNIISINCSALNPSINFSISAYPSFYGFYADLEKKKTVALLFQQFLTLKGSITSWANVVKDIWCSVIGLDLILWVAHFSFHLHVCDNWMTNS